MNVNYYFCMYKSYFFVVVVAALLPRMHIINILPASAYKHTEAAFFFGCFFYFLLFLLLFHTRILCVDLVFNFVSFDCSIRGRPQIEKKKNSTKRNSIGTRWRRSCYGRKLRQLHLYFCVCVIVAHRVQRARGRSTRFLTVSIERHAINTTLHNKLRSSKGSRTKIEMWQSIPVELAWHESLDSMYKYNVSIFSVPRYLIHHKIWCNQITHFYQAIRCIISLCFFFLVILFISSMSSSCRPPKMTDSCGANIFAVCKLEMKPNNPKWSQMSPANTRSKFYDDHFVFLLAKPMADDYSICWIFLEIAQFDWSASLWAIRYRHTIAIITAIYPTIRSIKIKNL